MFRRAFLALVPALTLLMGCSNDDEPTTKPPNTLTVIGNVSPVQNTFVALDNGRVGALGWTMQHDSRHLVSYVRLGVVRGREGGRGDRSDAAHDSRDHLSSVLARRGAAIARFATVGARGTVRSRSIGTEAGGGVFFAPYGPRAGFRSR